MVMDEESYTIALSRAFDLAFNEERTEEECLELDRLSRAVEAYENVHYPMGEDTCDNKY